MHRIAALALETLEPFDAAGVVEVLTGARVADHYAFTIATATGGPVATTHGYDSHAGCRLAGARAGRWSGSGARASARA